MRPGVVVMVMPMIVVVVMMMLVKRQRAFGFGTEQGAVFRGAADMLGRAFAADMAVQADHPI